MTTEDKKTYNTICYLVSLVCFTIFGYIANNGPLWVVGGAIVGLLFAWAWLNTRAKSSFDDVEQNF